MLLYGGYKPQRIHKGGTPMPFSLTGPHKDFTTELLSEHTPLNSVNVISVNNAILINRKRISVYQALFLHAGYQASNEYTYYIHIVT